MARRPGLRELDMTFQPPPPPPGTRPPIATAPLYRTPIEQFRLTVDADPSARHRRTLILISSFVAMVAVLLAGNDLANQQVSGGLHIGLGRLADMVEDQGWGFGWLLSAFEYAHFAALFLFMAVATGFGATRRDVWLPGEAMIFHRRQSPWVAANGIALGATGLIVGQIIAAMGLSLLSIPLEIICLSLLGTSVWRALVPEARMAMSVILDNNAGWGNRIILSGGMLRMLSRVTITKDALISGAARDIGGLELVAGARTLILKYVDDEGASRSLPVSGIAPDPEVGALASLLNTRFKLGLTPRGMERAAATNRLPAEVGFIFGD